MSSLKSSPLGAQIDYVKSRTDGIFGDVAWTARDKGKVFYIPAKDQEPDLWFLQCNPIKHVAKLACTTDHQANASLQLNLLLKALAKGDNQGLDFPVFRRHADALIKELQPTFLVHSLQMFTTGMRFAIKPVFNVDKIAESVEWFADQGLNYWRKFNEDFYLNAKMDVVDKDYWNLKHTMLFNDSVVEQLESGQEAIIDFEWLKPLEVGTVAGLSVFQTHLVTTVVAEKVLA